MIHPAHSLTRRALLGAVAAAPVAAALTACSGGEPAPADRAGPVTEVTYLTNFGALGRDSYAWLAQRRGAFAEAGLAVVIEPGTGTTPNVAALLAGQAQFAAIDLAGAAMARAEQDGFVAIGAIHQRPLAAVMAYEDSGISHGYDLAGRTVGLPAGAVTELMFPAYLSAVGLERDDVEQVALEPAGLVPALASGQVDAIGQFVVGRPLVAAAGGGREVSVLPYGDYLDDLYGVGIFTTAELADQDPELCGRFRDALLGGLRAAMDDPAAAGAVLAEEHPETDPDVASAEMSLMVPYSRVPGGGEPLGHIDRVRLARHIALLAAAGLLGPDPDVEPEDLAEFSLVPGGRP